MATARRKVVLLLERGREEYWVSKPGGWLLDQWCDTGFEEILPEFKLIKGEALLVTISEVKAKIKAKKRARKK